MSTFLQPSSLSLQIMFIIFWFITLVLQLNFQYILCAKSSQTSHFTVNFNILSRMKRMSGEISNPDSPSSSTVVNIFYRIRADRKGLITCEVNLKEDDPVDSNANTSNQTKSSSDSMSQKKPTSTLYLICPQLPTSICYMDCNPNCLLNEHGCSIPHSISQVIEGCQFKRLSVNTFQYQYIINMEKLDNTGLWNCEYRGQRAVRSLELQAAEFLPINVTDNKNNNNVDNSIKLNLTSKTNYSLQNIQNHSEIDKLNSIKIKDKTKDTQQKLNISVKNNTTVKFQSNLSNPIEEWKYHTVEKSYFRSAQRHENSPLLEFKLTRPELVLSLVGILAISLVVNIVLIIRCVLLKSYLDNAIQGKLSSNLKCLLCLRSKSNLKRLNTMEKSLNQSNHQPILMTSCQVGQLIEPNTSFMNYSTQFDDNLTESILLYQNKPDNFTPNDNNRLLPVNTGIILSNLFQPTMSTTLTNTTTTTNGSFVTTTPALHHLVNGPLTMTKSELLKFHGQNGQSSSGVSLESDPIGNKRINLFHSQSVNYSKSSSHQAQLPEYSFQNGNTCVIGQNGSLNGSLIYSNDSISLTDTTNGNAVVNPNHVILTQNPLSAYLMQYGCSGEQSEKTARRYGRQQQQQQSQHFYPDDYGRSSHPHISSQITHSEGKSPRLRNDHPHSRNMDNDETCNLIPEMHTNQDFHAYTFRNSSTIDSLSHDTNNSVSHLDDSLTLQSNQLSPCLTPLVVRFPSGESGFLFCPARTTNDTYQSESLSRRSNHISIISNYITRPIDKDIKTSNPFIEENLNVNIDCIKTNLEAIRLGNLYDSSHLSQNSDNETKISFLPDNTRPQCSISGNIAESIHTNSSEYHQNNKPQDIRKTLNIISTDHDSSFKPSLSQCINPKDVDEREINGSESVSQKNIPKVCESNHFSGSSDDALNEEKSVHKLVMNSKTFPVC